MQTFTQAALVVVTVVLSIVLVLLARRVPAVARSAAGPAVTSEMLGGILRAAEPITVGGTVVRAMRDTDAPAVGATIDDVVIDAMGWPGATIARDYALWVAAGRLPHFALVTDAAGGGVVGVVALEPLPVPAADDVLGLVHVGMWAGPTGRGAGHMSRAVSSIADLLARHRIELVAETAVDNVGARRVLERAGMSAIAERTVRLPDGREVAAVVYQRTPA